MSRIENDLLHDIKNTVKEAFAVDADDLVMVEIPKDPENGDYATNIAMRLAKTLKRKPQDIASIIKEKLLAKDTKIDRIEVAGPGFINFWMRKDALADAINTIIESGDCYGENTSGQHKKVLLEYVSANPTGILHLGHARGAAWGDSVAKLMQASGFDVTREYYVNDAGNQMQMLALSLYARYREAFGLDFALPEDGYHGQDVKDIALKIKERDQDKWLHKDEKETLDFMRQAGRELEIARIKNDLDYYRCHFDSWVSEQKIVDEKRVEKVMELMKAKGLTYEKDGAIWFASSEYGDDKDRVLLKSDGNYTYLTPDIAYHLYKLERGYDLLVDFLGADHHGYIARMKAAIEALGYNRDTLEVDIIQMVRLVENGEEVKMSKRTGNAVTIRELCDDIGVDATRYFFLSKALDTHMDFDLSLARQKTNENPVYYAQYAHARMCSILRQAKPVQKQEHYYLLIDEKETALLKHLGEFPSLVADSAINRSPNKICNYIQKLAQYFHSFYSSCRVNDPDNPELSNERLALLTASKITLKNALAFLGVSAPEKM